MATRQSRWFVTKITSEQALTCPYISDYPEKYFWRLREILLIAQRNLVESQAAGCWKVGSLIVERFWFALCQEILLTCIFQIYAKALQDGVGKLYDQVVASLGFILCIYSSWDDFEHGLIVGSQRPELLMNVNFEPIIRGLKSDIFEV